MHISYCLFAAICSIAVGTASAAEIYGLGDNSYRIGAVSPNGRWVAGTHIVPPEQRPPCPPTQFCSVQAATRWSLDSGVEFYSDFFFGQAISDDGLSIGGSSSREGATRRSGPTMWGPNGNLDLGEIEGVDDVGHVTGISANGLVAVGAIGGRSFDPPLYSSPQAFRWTEDAGIQGLGDLPGGTIRSFATAVSADGKSVVGEGTSGDDRGSEAFLWTEETGMVGLGFLPGRIMSTATDVSDDGRVVVGYGFGPGGRAAFRWTLDSGIVALPFATANAVTADGSTIVGTYWDGDAAIWDIQNGARRLADALSDDYGLSLSGWNLESAVDISADGNTIIGHGEYHGEHWVVVVPEPAARVILLGMIFGLVACRHQGMS